MKNLQDQIDRAKQEAIRVFQEKYQNDVDEYVPCVFIQKLLSLKTHVGWRFTKTGTPTHDIQQDVHPAYEYHQIIVWVWSKENDYETQN